MRLVLSWGVWVVWANVIFRDSLESSEQQLVHNSMTDTLLRPNVTLDYVAPL